MHVGGSLAAIPGLDGIFFGPGDFSVLAGITGQVRHPIVAAAQERIAAAAKGAGKRWGMPALGLDHAAQIQAMGASFIAAVTDIVLLKQGFERIQEQYGPLGFAFDNRLAQGARPV